MKSLITVPQAPLWDAGWRWLGTLGRYSCPDCPPVVLVVNGVHRAPGRTESAA
ncbi:hypothetical protein [Streptomyces sp. SLBN-31]|uniref:hypothetical protein n=1 Tax=Streptomyces sp. SLBN-31 TaxID=2768444 RepID=UPI001358B35B|nr:hypothetical protein [Streptomyces sp. SLBN-31]